LKYTNSTTTAIKYKNLKTRSVASPKLWSSFHSKCSELFWVLCDNGKRSCKYRRYYSRKNTVKSVVLKSTLSYMFRLCSAILRFCTTKYYLKVEKYSCQHNIIKTSTKEKHTNT
jgi:hypothetical protein